MSAHAGLREADGTVRCTGRTSRMLFRVCAEVGLSSRVLVIVPRHERIDAMITKLVKAINLMASPQLKRADFETDLDSLMVYETRIEFLAYHPEMVIWGHYDRIFVDNEIYDRGCWAELAPRLAAYSDELQIVR